MGPLLRLAVLTTACGSLALLLSGFPGLVELGLLALAGILAAGAVTWWIVADWVPADLGRAMPTLQRVRALGLPVRGRYRVGAVLLVFAAVTLAASRHPW